VSATQTYLKKIKHSMRAGFVNEMGYTLITTAIVIMALGFVITALAGVYFIYERKQSLIETESKMTHAREALERYVEIKGHLPCPAPLNASQDSEFYNAERKSGSACRTASFSGIAAQGVKTVNGFHAGASNPVHIGGLPTRTLGIPDQMALDGYRKRIIYAVTASYTDPATAEFQKAQGQIDMQDENRKSVLNDQGTAVYTIISPGLDDRGAYTIDGVRIQPCDPATFAGGNCAFEDAVFNVSMNRTFGVGNQTYTNTFYYKAALDVYKWDLTYGSCTCPDKVRQPVFSCVDQNGNASDPTKCKSNQPPAGPIDCSGEAVVDNCYGWSPPVPTYTEPSCSQSCGQPARTLSYQADGVVVSCMERVSNDGPITGNDAADGKLSCYREGMNDPVFGQDYTADNFATRQKTCAKTDACYQWRQSWNDNWGSCSASCDGTQTRASVWECYNPETGAGVGDAACIAQGNGKPAANIESRSCGGTCVASVPDNPGNPGGGNPPEGGENPVDLGNAGNGGANGGVHTRTSADNTGGNSDLDSCFFSSGCSGNSGASGYNETSGERGDRDADGDGVGDATGQGMSSAGRDGGGSSSGGGRVICTHFYRRGRLPSDLYFAEMEHTMKYMHPVIVRGYHVWAINVVRRLRQNDQDWFGKFWWFITINRAEEIAYQMGVREKPNYVGKLIRAVFEPACYVIGLLCEPEDYKTLYNKEERRTFMQSYREYKSGMV